MLELDVPSSSSSSDACTATDGTSTSDPSEGPVQKIEERVNRDLNSLQRIFASIGKLLELLLQLGSSVWAKL